MASRSESGKRTYEELLRIAADSLRHHELAQAKAYIFEAMLENSDAPEPQNLLGILAEMNGDMRMAERHYRAACALEPTFEPGYRNLDRVTSLFNLMKEPEYDYGLPSGKKEKGK